jgi:hypothetical protein
MEKNNCENCVHAFVDPIWGDIKCRAQERFCMGREIENGCNKWKGNKSNGKPKTSTMADRS